MEITQDELKELYIVGFTGRNKAPEDIRDVIVTEMPLLGNSDYRVVSIGAKDIKLPYMHVTLGTDGYVNISSGAYYCNHKAIIDQLELIKNR